MKKINIAILGMGTVGGGTYEILTKNRKNIARNEGVDVNVAWVLDKNTQRLKELNVPDDKIAPSLEAIINDDSVSLVVEVIGGIETAKVFILKALNAGKSVVTANKELVAKYWSVLEAEAKKHGAGLYFEASCVGGVPIIRALTDSMQANNITGISGIFNGTTNYILTKMTEDKISYSKALAEAQALGYAEANPASDVEGFDSMYKLSILSSLSFHTCVPINVIYREGITNIKPLDIQNADEFGYVIKLLAIAKKTGNKIEARVHPCLVEKSHPLASVRGSFNAVHLVGDSVGDVMLYGKGAGALPTGSAIVSDIIFAAKYGKHRYSRYKNDNKLSTSLKLITDFAGQYYIMVNCMDKPGVLAKMTQALGKAGVSLDSVMQRAQKGDYVSVVFFTHDTTEKAVQKAVNAIGSLDCVKSVESVIRIF